MKPDVDPTTAAKLLRVIEALQRGDDLFAAAKTAGLDAATARRFLDSMKGELEARAARSRAAARSEGTVGRVIAYSDGASRGNPGEAACAVILTDEHGEEYLRRSKRLGVATNNVAEYEAVIYALELAAALGARDVLLKLDSELVARQLSGAYKVKNEGLVPLWKRATTLTRKLDRFEVEHVPRAQMKAADRLANDALDGRDSDLP